MEEKNSQYEQQINAYVENVQEKSTYITDLEKENENLKAEFER